MNVFVKLIVTVKLKGLSLGRFLTKTKAMVKAQEDNPTMVPGLDPDAPTVKLKIKAIDDKNTERKVLVQKVKDLTGEIKDLITEVTNIMTSDWAPAIQKAADGDANFVKTLCFSSKGEDKTPPVVTINNSIPTIINLTTNQSLKQEMEVINSNTKGSRLPAGAKDCAIFLLVGTTEPTDIFKMTYLGVTQKGKFSHTFVTADIGKTAYYIAVYTSKITGKPVSTVSIIAKLTIT